MSKKGSPGPDLPLSDSELKGPVIEERGTLTQQLLDQDGYEENPQDTGGPTPPPPPSQRASDADRMFSLQLVEKIIEQTVALSVI